MIEQSKKGKLVNAISVARLIAAVIFAVIIMLDLPRAVIAVIYALAAVSDLIDGFIARKLATTSHTGKIIDLMSDKSLTAVSLLYAATRGVDILPLALIAVREIINLSTRIITVDGAQLIPTNKFFGGSMVALLWGATLVLIVSNQGNVIAAVNLVFWICAAIYSVNLAARLVRHRERIGHALN